MKKQPEKQPFVPGLELAEGFYRESVKPILDSGFPGLRYSAALIGGGSEVLRFDTEMSSDHHWGPRVMLFLRPDDWWSLKKAIRALLGRKLPFVFRGYPTSFSPPDPDDHGVQILEPIASGPVNHRVELFTLGGFFHDYLGIDIDKKLEAVDWLTLPQHKLRSLVSGSVFHDDLGLERIRKRLTWYPRDVWVFILASLWARIGQEEHLMGRAGLSGDEIGSSIIGSRLARDGMRLAFMMEKVYPPYAKWFGTAFASLKSAKKLLPVLEHIVHSGSWQEREKHLAKAYSILAQMHNALSLTEALPTAVSWFWGRPFQVIKGERFASALLDKIAAPRLKPLLKRSPIGSIDVFSDNTDLLEDPAFQPIIRRLYE
jgi:hypothetical protein